MPACKKPNYASAQLSARTALAASGGVAGERELRREDQFPPEFPGIRAEVSAKLKEPSTQPRQFEDVVKSAEQAAVLVY